MTKRVLGLLCAIAVSGLGDGCAYMNAHWPRQLNLTPRTNEFHQHTEGSAGTAAARRLPAARAHEESAPEPVAAVAPPTASVAPPTASVAPPGATLAPPTSKVTLSSDEANRSQAEKLLNETGVRLARIDHSRLDGEDAATYQQATGLADAARKALEQGDYLTASGLAQKASVLTKALTPKAPPR